MKEFVDLRFQSLVIAGIMISQSIYRNPCRKIKIFFSLCIIKPTAFSTVKHDRKSVIGMKNTFFCLLHLFMHAHHNIFRRPLLK